MKFATILSIVFIAVPTLAISAEQYERSYNVAESDLYDREVDESVDYLTREDLNDILGRELVDEIDERSPFGIFTAIKAAVRVGKVVNSAVQSRKHNKRDLEFDDDLEMREDLNDIFGRELVNEIDERSPGIFGIAKAAFRVGSAVKSAVQSRKNKRDLESDEVLEEREPSIMKGVIKQIGGREVLEEREPSIMKGVIKQIGGREVLEEREPNFLKGFAKLFKGREVLEEREPGMKGFIKQVGGREVLEEREFDEEMFEREFEEYFEREFDDLD